MGEPWLDSLSEDWNSEPQQSSPASSLADSKHEFRSSGTSQSRIPHLAHNMRRDSSSSSFLKPRSSRGIAKSKGIPVLSERSASNLNVAAHAAQDISTKRQTSASSTFPRRTSSNFSDSQQSVQHHTINASSKDTPEWKRRLQNGEEIASDGFDLFSPSKLEGMFAQPAVEQENYSAFAEGEAKPWTSLKVSQVPATSDQYMSLRTSRSRAPRMESVPEMNEEEDGDEDENEAEADAVHRMSAISSELVREGALRGLVRRRVDDFEQPLETGDNSQTSNGPVLSHSRDPRWRTLSGQQEMRNEYISPVTASAKNSITQKAVQNSADLDPRTLQQKLMKASSERQKRPSSRSSDRDVSYNGHGLEKEESFLHDESLRDMTSHSLPEDLSMGTQDFASHGGYINTRRGPGSDDSSFLRKRLSSVNGASRIEQRSAMNFRSSPPPYNMTKNGTEDESKVEDTLSSSLQDDSVVHHDTSPQRPASAGSPLKLFGNRDTYTNNKLLRVLSQYEDPSEHSKSEGNKNEILDEESKLDNGLHMSQFGKGELDSFNFEKQVMRPQTAPASINIDSAKIFQSLADLSIDDEGTIYDTRPAGQNATERDVPDPEMKRLPSSPSKDRTPKRRRTLVRDGVVVEQVQQPDSADMYLDKTSLAGKKRKDAKPGEAGEPADPDVLASRAILRPRSGSRRSSGNIQHDQLLQTATVKQQATSGELKEALAAELASFVQEASEARQDSRKPSLATKDYMEEANKVMEFIRARGKPKSNLPQIQEPADSSELDADRILDLELDDDSTEEPFSRPPSREGPLRPREDRRIAKHDPRVASHLRKFKDSDDLEILASTSAMGTLNLVNNRVAAEAALVPVPLDEQENNPPNIKISDKSEAQRKRRHSVSRSDEQVDTVGSSDSSTRRTFATESSQSSGQKGMITSGTVSIPDQVGTMTFDHERQIWIKQQLKKSQRKHSQSQRSVIEKHEEVTLEDDPFENIPDLSIDEQREAAMRAVPRSSSRPSTANTVQRRPLSRQSDTTALSCEQVEDDDVEQSHSLASHNETMAADKTTNTKEQDLSRRQTSLRSEVSKHEERLHEGLPSRAPTAATNTHRQPRVVTIAFSSPVASEIPHLAPISTTTTTESDDDNDFLPPEDSDDDEDYMKTPRSTPFAEKTISGQERGQISTGMKSGSTRMIHQHRRPVSRIEERDEDADRDEGLSMVHVKESKMMTPAARDQTNSAKPVSAYRGTSILCLTPLSEFTMHQADRANHPEESFVQARANPKALLQAHGSLALSVDTLVKAITDAVPDEPFWEQLRRLDLSDSQLPSAHGLENYCSALEELDLSKNSVVQLDGLPSTLRHLNMSSNLVNDFTSWNHLQNLQYVDVSSNRLENLEAFSSLVHMRRFRACNNNIHDIEGILDLDGLISLNLHDNQLTQLDFEGVDLPRLEELDLSGNKLSTVLNLHFLPCLQRIDLSGNNLDNLQTAEPLPFLRSLVISNNELKGIDLAMFPMLEELILDGNCITSIQGLPDAINLRKLSLRNQRDAMDIVSSILTTPNECNEIRLSSNVLACGQMKLPRLPHYNLRRLELAGCGLQNLPLRFGDYFPNCRDLNLNFNAVSDLSPLLGIVKLQKLFVSGNRVKRLRRTCLVLTRMAALQAVDLRNNPLTVGFYAPEYCESVEDDEYLLPSRPASKDGRWLQLLDETTGLRRRMIELLLGQGCPSLNELDGMPFAERRIKEQDNTWDNLMARRVLVKALEAPPAQPLCSPSAVEMPGNRSTQI